MLLQQSGLPWTILRPSRLTDGPYTSFDLNTLLQATAGARQDVQISMQDDQLGEASRIAVAGVTDHPPHPPTLPRHCIPCAVVVFALTQSECIFVHRPALGTIASMSRPPCPPYSAGALK